MEPQLTSVLLVDPPGVYLTSMRLWATSAALIGLIGAVAGAVAVGRGRRRDAGPARLVALLAGSISLLGGVLNLVSADGGPGTGNGVVAGGLAVLLGAVATGLGALALRRARTAGLRARH